MGGLCGVASKEDCVHDLFYGTDYHSHLGTVIGGLVVNGAGNPRIRDISNAQFRSKFEDDIGKMNGGIGVGVISDYEVQPLGISSHLGDYYVAHVGRINNLDNLAAGIKKLGTHFADRTEGNVNPAELVAALINQEESYVKGIESAQRQIEGSSSILLLTKEGIYAARDYLGRTPLSVGRGENGWMVVSETTAYPNLDYEFEHELGPGEIVYITPEGYDVKKPQNKEMQICAFLWVYYGFPASNYEGINVEIVRNNCGRALARVAKAEGVEIDIVAGLPDSGTAHGLGFANEIGIPFGRPFVKYTPTWPRSFMPQDQERRDLVAKMKLVPIRELIRGKRLLFCEDSIVRGTQLEGTIKRLYDCGAKEVHMRPACPPLIYGCRFLNFSRSKSALALAARKGIKDIEGHAEEEVLAKYKEGTSDFGEMVERIRKRLRLTSLGYQKLDDLVSAIGLPKERLCTHCWDGGNGCKDCKK